MNLLETRTTLLLRIRDLQDRIAWSEFVALYMPLLYAYALKRGLQDADAADVAQEAICKVVRSIECFDYDASKGSFRGWLLTITLNQIRDQAKRNRISAQPTGDTEILELLNQQPSPQLNDQWEYEYRLHLFHWAAERVKHEFRDSTWQAFWQTSVQNAEVEQVAESLELSIGAIYIARSRVLARIRAVVDELEL